MSTVTLETSHGNIVIELNDEKAPATVKNFLSYVNDGFYDGTIFHRVIPNFMVQGGGFMPGMVQKKVEEPIQNEADNGLVNDRGTVAMARTNDPHSATAQFFINHNDNGFLNHTAPSDAAWGYCVFGKVTDGMDAVDAIAAVSTSNDGGHGDVPTETVTINKASTS
ncbi:Peptidyl-prolyl cis-trans isomerase PpiB [hydrothermal vent metagenome]|uniref:peptidylprolyl isomerase n=1 Tax=hydrothermal vent metagenome TaxID=652676 RepID=A0A3B0WEZ9_9ZZZZ